MNNEVLFFVSLIAAFTAVVMAHKFFGKEGLFAWIAVATILANILVTKQIRLFGLDATMGNIMFASIYLCTDILSEIQGIQQSKKAIRIGLCAALLFVAVSQSAILFQPNKMDIISEPMAELFAMSARTTIASVTMFYLANLADIYLFERLKQKYPDALWLRNNVSTILCNCAENFLFIIAAFIGTYSLADCIVIAATTSVIEMIVAVCDTPFLYAARKIK
ncbi:MAG: queuosine precursor transporter [Eubacteriales bacterium]|nr:queuosine precursor transporter [Eubacteriales bacterium]